MKKNVKGGSQDEWVYCGLEAAMKMRGGGGRTVSNFRNFSFVCLVPPNDRESSYKG